MYTSHSRIDGYHQKECGGGQDSGFIGASEVEIFETKFLSAVGLTEGNAADNEGVDRVGQTIEGGHG